MKEGEEGEIVEKKASYNPWKQHEVSDKSVADCFEALIGAYLLNCGSDAAKDFLHWIGIGVHEVIKWLMMAEFKLFFLSFLLMIVC